MVAFAPGFVTRAGAVRGTFEAHLTVATERRGEFEALCAELGVDCVAIELPAGAHPAQPMTASHHRGDLAAVVAEVEALHARLEGAGFPVVRTKLEAAVGNAGIPTEGGYFEFHVKVRVPDAARLVELGTLAASHGGRLSRNDRRRDEHGAQRFVTLRVHGVERPRAEAELDALVAALDTAGFARAGIAREYTIYDSRIELDAGWLDAP